MERTRSAKAGEARCASSVRSSSAVSSPPSASEATLGSMIDADVERRDRGRAVQDAALELVADPDADGEPGHKQDGQVGEQEALGQGRRGDDAPGMRQQGVAARAGGDARPKAAARQRTTRRQTRWRRAWSGRVGRWAARARHRPMVGAGRAIPSSDPRPRLAIGPRSVMIPDRRPFPLALALPETHGRPSRTGRRGPGKEARDRDEGGTHTPRHDGWSSGALAVVMLALLAARRERRGQGRRRHHAGRAARPAPTGSSSSARRTGASRSSSRSTRTRTAGPGT